VFHGLSASKSRPDGAVVGVDAVVDVLVLEVDDELVDDVVGRLVDVDVDVERVVDDEVLDDDVDPLVDDDDELLDEEEDEVEVDEDVVVGGRVVDVLVVEVDVVVVFLLRAVSSKPQVHPVHASPAAQSAPVSHVSPRIANSTW